jgi:hypothetical protein
MELVWQRAEDCLRYYLRRFNRFQSYDGITPTHFNEISDDDRRLANKIAARMSAATWVSIVGESIAGVGDWDLLRMTDVEWQTRKQIIRDTLSGLLGHPGIGVARLTKGLHRKRPNLIPVCDSVVLKALGVNLGSRPSQVVVCMDRLRVIGRGQLTRLRELRELSRGLDCEMTDLRILEILYWVQFGPFPPDGK